MAIGRDEKRACLARELAFRRQVYPRQVESGRMTQAEMDREIAVMAAILDDYRDDRQAELFASPPV